MVRRSNLGLVCKVLFSLSLLILLFEPASACVNNSRIIIPGTAVVDMQSNSESPYYCIPWIYTRILSETSEPLVLTGVDQDNKIGWVPGDLNAQLFYYPGSGMWLLMIHCLTNDNSAGLLQFADPTVPVDIPFPPDDELCYQPTDYL